MGLSNHLFFYVLSWSYFIFKQMKLTQEVIDQIQEAMNHTKRNGDTNWEDGDDIDVCLAGTFAADRFIVIHNRTKSSTSLHNFKVENIKILPGTYDVVVSKKLLSRFTSQNYNLKYYIALEPDSTFE